MRRPAPCPNRTPRLRLSRSTSNEPASSASAAARASCSDGATSAAVSRPACRPSSSAISRCYPPSGRGPSSSLAMPASAMPASGSVPAGRRAAGAPHTRPPMPARPRRRGWHPSPGQAPYPRRALPDQVLRRASCSRVSCGPATPQIGAMLGAPAPGRYRRAMHSLRACELARPAPASGNTSRGLPGTIWTLAVVPAVSARTTR
jgi:hypothetical protein